MTSLIVQAGILNDRSKDIRIETEKILKNNNLEKEKIEVITSGFKSEKDTKKIIKISIFMPKLGNGVSSSKDLKTNQYAWASIPDEQLIIDKDYSIIYQSEVLKPWILIQKN